MINYSISMKKIIFIFCINTVLFSCASIGVREKAIIASNYMINDILHDINNIKNYYYNPVDGINYIFLNIYNDVYNVNEEENASLNYKEYLSDDFFIKLEEIRNYFGEIIEYEILNIEYEYNIFPFYDYGYPHLIDIELKIYYKNIVIMEHIRGYYIKEIDKINIVGYSIRKYKE